MNTKTITIDKKKYRLIDESEYLSIKNDIADLKKIFARKSEKGVEANAFFQTLDKKTKTP